MPRSIRVREDCIYKVKSSLKRNGYIRQLDLAEVLDISQSTVSNFVNGKPVDFLNFLEVCDKLSLEWKEIADLDTPDAEFPSPLPAPSQISPGRSRVEIVLNAKLDEIDWSKLKAILDDLQQVVGDTSLTIKRIEAGSVFLEFEGSQEAVKQIEYLFRTKQLKEIAGVPILDVRLTPVNLSQWWQNVFSAEWQTVKEVLGTEKAALVPSYRNTATVERAKLIELGMPQPFALTVACTAYADALSSILLQVHPTGTQQYLPPNLHLIVLDESGEPVLDEASEPLAATATRADNYIQLQLYGEAGEGFRVKIVLGDASVTENFVI